MSHTIKGILIVAAIASMLVLGASMLPLAQNTYASSHRHQDNILNQKDETYRSPGSQSSNVAIQESGKGNSPTAFSDQSNNIQQQNQPTSSQQQDPQSNKDKDKNFPITLNVLPNQRIINTNVNPNTNTANSNSSSTSDASNDNTINNTALARQRQAEASCAVALTCPEGSTTVTPPATGTLLVKKVVDCSPPSDLPEFCNQFHSSDFTILVTGNNPTPSTFPGSESGTAVTLGSGQFMITDTHTTNGSPVNPSVVMFYGDCKRVDGTASATGTIAAGEHKTCTVANLIIRED